MTDRYAVFGNPISHSKSPQIHLAFARSMGDEIEYIPIEAPIDGFPEALRAFFDAGGRGANITVPFKLQAAEFADIRRDSVLAAGAANCLKIENGQVVAENFDGKGIVIDIEANLGVSLKDKSVLILGAGGATRGAVLPILEAGAASLTIANRTVSKADALARDFAKHGKLRAIGYDDLTGRYDIVINATSASLSGGTLPLPDAALKKTLLAYDMVYGKGLTPFLAQAKRVGAGQIADGVGMLVEQAAEAFAWWRGTRPETANIIREITVPLV